jgi:dipeptidyl aminopeptidase/acylaminoacyl peptidase
MKILSLVLSISLIISSLAASTTSGQKVDKPFDADPVLAKTAPTAIPPQCGGKIAFVSFRDFDGNGEIYVMDPDGSNPTRLVAHNATEGAPDWSPDGTRLAFQSDRDNLINSRPDIYVMNANGSNITRLTTSPADDESPVWSPDGNKIAFASSRDAGPGGPRQLYLMNADGSGQTRLTFNAGGINPKFNWSPDGTRIGFSKNSSAFPDTLDIYTIVVATGDIFQVTHAAREGEHFTDPVWSPDAQQIVFTYSFVQISDVFVMRPDGTNQTNLTQTPGGDLHPDWTPDGSAIVFQSFRDGNSEIYWMYPNGSGQTRLTNISELDTLPSVQLPQSNAPCLLAEAVTNHAAALESVNFLRDPFKVVTSLNFSSDHRTRITLFAKNVRLLPGDDASAITVQAEDAQHQLHALTVENVATVPGYGWLTQVTAKLPDSLIGAGNVNVIMTLHGATSNQMTITIAP